ncbi:hypothetical protein DFH08DRAFT_961954 [Mycena albidolilacea]|uniref:Secreted protein n=1 Tax=Mycena albidolilacea TaxID=1033008 RepID=A0AAD7ER46_9AGAR|nr:hypothetical protein DFH08DRAFT_961954 [Mycena albidolilacea]
MLLRLQHVLATVLLPPPPAIAPSFLSSSTDTSAAPCGHPGIFSRTYPTAPPPVAPPSPQALLVLPILPADAPNFILEHVPLLLPGPSPASSPYLALYTMAGGRLVSILLAFVLSVPRLPNLEMSSSPVLQPIRDSR